MSEHEKLKAKLARNDKTRENQRALAMAQDCILLIANLLLPFSDKGREYIIEESVEIADRLTPKKKVKKEAKAKQP